MDFTTEPAVSEGLAPREAPRQRLEDALETFLSRLPAWRGGQRENGRHASESPDRDGNATAEASRSGSRRKPWKDKKERSKSRSRDRRRPSPVPVKTRGSNFDSGPKRVAPPGSALGTPPPKEEKKKDEKKEKKEDKKRDKDRDRDRDRGKDRGRRDRDASRSVSNVKRKKDRKKEKDRSRSRGKASRSRSSSGGKKKKESKLAEPPAGDSWLPKSPEPERPKAPLEPPRAPKSNPAPVPGEGRPAAPLPQGKPDNVPDWLQDLFGGQNSGGNVAGPLLRPRVPHREVMVPQQCVARLIGKGGETIMAICNTTGADVKIRQETKELGYSLAIITGHPDAMDAAERLVRQKLGLSGTGFASKELTLQTEHVPTVMGPKGATLARIRQQSGNLAIELRPPDVPGMPHTAMLGPGSQEQLMVAEQLIMAAVATAITNK